MNDVAERANEVGEKMRLACSLVSFAHFSPGRSYLCYITNAYWVQMSQKKQGKQTLY